MVLLMLLMLKKLANLANLYTKMSASDGHHDNFHKKEYVYYMPIGWNTQQACIDKNDNTTNCDPQVSENTLYNDVFGSKQDDQTNEQEINIPYHALRKIKEEMGYNYYSISRSETPTNQGIKLDTILNKIDPSQQSNIYLFVDVPGGIFYCCK